MDYYQAIDQACSQLLLNWKVGGRYTADELRQIHSIFYKHVSSIEAIVLKEYGWVDDLNGKCHIDGNTMVTIVERLLRPLITGVKDRSTCTVTLPKLDLTLAQFVQGNANAIADTILSSFGDKTIWNIVEGVMCHYNIKGHEPKAELPSQQIYEFPLPEAYSHVANVRVLLRFDYSKLTGTITSTYPSNFRLVLRDTRAKTESLLMSAYVNTGNKEPIKYILMRQYALDIIMSVYQLGCEIGHANEFDMLQHFDKVMVNVMPNVPASSICPSIWEVPGFDTLPHPHPWESGGFKPAFPGWGGEKLTMKTWYDMDRQQRRLALGYLPNRGEAQLRAFAAIYQTTYEDVKDFCKRFMGTDVAPERSHSLWLHSDLAGRRSMIAALPSTSEGNMLEFADNQHVAIEEIRVFCEACGFNPPTPWGGHSHLEQRFILIHETEQKRDLAEIAKKYGIAFGALCDFAIRQNIMIIYPKPQEPKPVTINPESKSAKQVPALMFNYGDKCIPWTSALKLDWTVMKVWQRIYLVDMLPHRTAVTIRDIRIQFGDTVADGVFYTHFITEYDLISNWNSTTFMHGKGMRLKAVLSHVLSCVGQYPTIAAAAPYLNTSEMDLAEYLATNSANLWTQFGIVFNTETGLIEINAVSTAVDNALDSVKPAEVETFKLWSELTNDEKMMVLNAAASMSVSLTTLVKRHKTSIRTIKRFITNCPIKKKKPFLRVK